ncbi:MAG: discoidin domain-containing protein [Bacteroidaceae bacterium]|nr:discoidin domain-containing protein [Bacteroidaceae bacterium]
MKRLLLSAIFALAFLGLNAQDKLKGFLYQTAPSGPTGEEWQAPESLAFNKEQPSAYMFHFATTSEAEKVLGENSAYYRTLDGTWKFHWVPGPSQRPKRFYRTDFDVSSWDDIEVPGCWNVQGLGKDGSMKYGVPIYVNQPVIFYHERKVNDWRKGVMRPAPEEWTVSKYPNEVGSYRRTFSVPSDWNGRRVFINFDGVDSFFYLWINGHYVGFSKNSRNTASFDVTPYVKEGAGNIVAVEVYRNSDASLLESQDMFRLPGIIRSTYLTSLPERRITDLNIRTERLDDSAAELSFLTKTNAADGKLRLTVKSLRLYTDDIDSEVMKVDLPLKDSKYDGALTLQNPRLWSAEAPNRYVAICELLDAQGKVLDCVSTYFGVCKVEIRDTKAENDEFGLAGRYFYVNNRPVKLKGVNRHETNPSRGHAITREQMRKEVFLMKRGNINHVRLSHYNNDPYFYYLANKYGLYLEDECNIESHQYYYGDASLSHPKEWEAAHVARNMEMVRQHVNHPSIVIWSLGNEAGPGRNFVAAYNAIKQFDQSRPVQYERNNDIVDMGSNQYPGVDWVRGAVKGKYDIKYPFHISEYAHSMGNAVGNLADYWAAIESSNFFCGAAIWDWVDQAIDTYTKDGTHYLGYGGDHGDWPNDGMFCMNGIMLPDLTPKPQYFEVKKVYQNVGVSAVDIRKGLLEIFNKNYFTSLSDYVIVCRLICDGKEVEDARYSVKAPELGPRQKTQITFPLKFSRLAETSEYFLNVEFRLATDKPWAKAGYVQMDEQIPVKSVTRRFLLVSNDRKALTLHGDDKTAQVLGDGFEVVFDNLQGTICQYNYGGKCFIAPGQGPLLDAYRAPVDNDNWCREAWYQNGLHDLAHNVVGKPTVMKHADGRVTASYTVLSQGKEAGRLQYRPGASGNPYIGVKAEKSMDEDDFHFTSNIIYTVYPDGSVEMLSSIVSSNASLALPRIGYQFRLPVSLSNYTYYGRGPVNNYNDRCTSQFIGLYESTVSDQFVNFPKPQSMGNREAVRWCALTDTDGDGLQFTCLTDSMSASALPWSAMQMTLAQHPYQLPQSDATYLHLDAKVNGLGGNSCGQGGPLNEDRVTGAVHQIGIVISPVSKSVSMISQSNVRTATSMPISIFRDLAGKVTVVGAKGKQIVCSVADDEVTNYTEPFDFKQGGQVSAWYKGNKESKVIIDFPKIEKVPVVVVSCSSQENGEGADRLLDGNPSTIWHTMYSVTVTKHPHWIDFDCGEKKLIKGFTYLARQSGSNGDVKGYKVELSDDGKTWGKPVSEGNLQKTKKEQRILFSSPVSARYLRFTAVSAHDGQDFASGAEFSVLAE